MVSILPQLDPGGLIGQGLGKGLGQGIEQAYERNLLRKGIGQVKDKLGEAKQSGESINPLDVVLDLSSALAPVQGGLQALSELGPVITKEVARQNIMKGLGDGDDVDQSREMPPNSIVNDGKDKAFQKAYQDKYREKLRITNDPELARQMTQDEMSGQQQEQQLRQTKQAATESILQGKIAENFTDGISAPFKNELSEEYFKLIEGSQDPGIHNKAWNQLMPKYRAAQVAEENLKNLSDSQRPLFFTGDMQERMTNARQALSPIANVDPEYAMSLAMNELDYGPAEAARVIKPGSGNFNRLIDSVKGSPYETESIKDYENWQKKTAGQLKKYLEKGWDKEKDSLLALRGELYGKGFENDVFVSTFREVFPEPNTDERLSAFNRNEVPKLAEPVVPGLAEIFSTYAPLLVPFQRRSKILRAGETLGRKISSGVRGKR